MATCRGVDVPVYQAAQNWTARKAEGVVLAFAKASEGEHTHDTRFAQHVTAVIGAGLVPGAYHLGWPNQSATTEAANYVAAVIPLPAEELKLVHDVPRHHARLRAEHRPAVFDGDMLLVSSTDPGDAEADLWLPRAAGTVHRFKASQGHYDMYGADTTRLVRDAYGEIFTGPADVPGDDGALN